MSLECGICPKCGHFVLLEDKPKGTRIGSYWSDSTLICNECKPKQVLTLMKSGSVNGETVVKPHLIEPTQTSRGKKAFNETKKKARNPLGKPGKLAIRNYH